VAKSSFYPHSIRVAIRKMDCSQQRSFVRPRLESRKHTRVPPAPAPNIFLPLSHVLDDFVTPENCGGRRKFGETEDIALLKEIVANDAHVCRRGKVTETFDEVARALNEGNSFPWNTNGKH
jgi:hypothetical protein